MKTHPDDNAFPIISFNSDGESNVKEYGLTKREYFAGLAMQGLLANPECSNQVNTPNIVFAVTCADLLLKELEQ